MGIILTLQTIRALFWSPLPRKPWFQSILTVGTACSLLPELSWRLTGDIPWKKREKSPTRSSFQELIFSWSFEVFISEDIPHGFLWFYLLEEPLSQLRWVPSPGSGWEEGKNGELTPVRVSAPGLTLIPIMSAFVNFSVSSGAFCILSKSFS